MSDPAYTPGTPEWIARRQQLLEEIREEVTEGMQGPPGPQGPAGPQGPPGEGGGGGGGELVTAIPTTDLEHGRTIRLKVATGLHWDLMYDTDVTDDYKWVAVAAARKLAAASITAQHLTMASQYVAADFPDAYSPKLTVPFDGYYELTQAADIWVAPDASGVWEYLLYVTKPDNTILSTLGMTEWSTGSSALLGGPTSLNRTELAGGNAAPIALTKSHVLKWRHEGSHTVASSMRSRARSLALAPSRLRA